MGQFIVVIPSERLAIVRLGVSSMRGDGIGETDRLVADIRAALRTSLRRTDLPGLYADGRKYTGLKGAKSGWPAIRSSNAWRLDDLR